MTDQNRMPVTQASARKKAEAAVTAFQASVYSPANDKRVVLGSLTNMTNLHGKPKKESKRDKTHKSTADDRIPLTRAAARIKAEAAVEAIQDSVLPPTKKGRVVLRSIANMTDLNTNPNKLQGKPKNKSKFDRTQKSMGGQNSMHVIIAATEKRAGAAAADAPQASSLCPTKKKRVILESITDIPNLCGEPENKSRSVKKHILHHINGGKPEALETLENVHISEVEECKESRIRRRKKAKNAFFIHEDIVFNILVFLPAECLHNTMRHVTDSWAEMIHSRSFIDAHLKHVKPVLYFHSLGCDHHLEFMGGQVPRLMVTGRHFQGMIWDTCDGLLLHHLKDGYVEVLNPITMQTLSIPYPNYQYSSCYKDSFTFTRVRHSGEFKVIRAYRDNEMKLNWCVRTLGSNEWRHIFPPGFKDTWKGNAPGPPLISIGDFVFMTDSSFCGHSTSFIMMDLRDESFHVIKFPESVQRNGMHPMARHKMGKCLYLIGKGTRDPSFGDFEIFVMKDFPNGEWIKYLKLSDRYFEVVGWSMCTFHHGVSCGWLGDGQWILKVPSWVKKGFRVYDCKSDKVYDISIDLGDEFSFCEQHTPSLVWWES